MVKDLIEKHQDKILYVVSGFMRTGTSMMMAALEIGGLDACYKQSREQMRKRFTDKYYDPNIGGLYELERQDYQEFGFPQKYEGKLIKALNLGVPNMSVMPNGIRVVFMRRHSEEIRQSYDAFFGNQLNDKTIDNLQVQQDNTIDRINNRKDVCGLDVFWYADVVENPTKYFKILQKNYWPINVAKSASIVDPLYRRFRIENLTVGII